MTIYNADRRSQALCGPFSSEDLPDYQAAIQHAKAHWRRLLSVTQYEILEAIIDRTARFGRYQAKIVTAWFYEGHDANPESGYAGCAPITPVSGKTFYAARAFLEKVGIVTRTDDTYAIDYSVTAIDLAADEDVQKRVLHENKRGGMLSTIEGIVEWAHSMVARMVKPSKQEQETVTPYTVQSNNTHGISKDKSSEIRRGGILWNSVSGFIMGERSLADVVAAAHNAVDDRREQLADKRRKRRTLADEVSLFEAAWQRGQREKDSSVPATRIIPRERKLLKDQLIKRYRDTSIDLEDFAHWTAHNWQAIGAQYFTKSRNYPDFPAFRWFLACLETYSLAYQKRDLLNADGIHGGGVQAQRALQRTMENASKADELTKRIADEAKGIKSERDKLLEENMRLREELGMPLDDDPQTAEAIQEVRANAVKIDFSKKWDDYEDDDTPKRRKLRRKRK